MQNTGPGGEKKSYRVILLLVVGLAAFSSAMKELNQVRELSMQTSELFAQWKDVIAPATDELTTVRVETCDNSQRLLPPSPPLPALPPLPAVEVSESDVPVVVAPEAIPAPPAPPKVRDVPPAPRRAARPAHDSAEVRVLLSTDEFVEKSIKDAFESEHSLKVFKAKNRRHIVITPEGRDVILKTLNRSINVRSAS